MYFKLFYIDLKVEVPNIMYYFFQGQLPAEVLQLPGLLAFVSDLRRLAPHARLRGHRHLPDTLSPQFVAQLCGRNVPNTPRPSETQHAVQI